LGQPAAEGRQLFQFPPDDPAHRLGDGGELRFGFGLTGTAATCGSLVRMPLPGEKRLTSSVKEPTATETEDF